MAGFEFDDKGYVASCPQGHKPEKVKHKKKRQRYSAYFAPSLCQACPHAKACPAKPGKKFYSVHYDAKQLRLTLRRKIEKTDEFTDSYRWRAGVEATMSAYDRRTGVKNLRVRGLNAVRFYAVLKAAGLNLIRAAVVRRARRKARQAENSLAGTFLKLFAVVKEQIYKIVIKSKPVLANWIRPGGRLHQNRRLTFYGAINFRNRCQEKGLPNLENVGYSKDTSTQLQSQNQGGRP